MKRFLLSMFALLSFATFTASASNVAIVNTHVKYVRPGADGSFYVSFTTDHPSCTSQSVPKRHWVVIGQWGMTAEGAKNIYAAAIAALVSERPVSVNFDDAGVNCAITQLLLQ